MVAIRITVRIQGLFSGFVTTGRYGKWYQPTALRDAAPAGIAVATMTSLRHRPTTDSHDTRALAEVYTVPVLPVFNEFDYNGNAVSARIRAHECERPISDAPRFRFTVRSVQFDSHLYADVLRLY